MKDERNNQRSLWRKRRLWCWVRVSPPLLGMAVARKKRRKPYYLEDELAPLEKDEVSQYCETRQIQVCDWSSRKDWREKSLKLQGPTCIRVSTCDTKAGTFDGIIFYRASIVRGLALIERELVSGCHTMRGGIWFGLVYKFILWILRKWP